jgi:predicted helicase
LPISKLSVRLAELHISYEPIEMFLLQIEGGRLLFTDAGYCVEMMMYSKTGKDKDLTTLVYNDKITVTAITLEAYEIVVNSKQALDWIVECQSVRTEKIAVSSTMRTIGLPERWVAINLADPPHYQLC